MKYNRYVVALLTDVNFVLFSCSDRDVWVQFKNHNLTSHNPAWFHDGLTVFPRWLSQFEIVDVHSYSIHSLFNVGFKLIRARPYIS